MSAPDAAFARALYDAAEKVAQSEDERRQLRETLCGELKLADEVLGQYPHVFYNPSVSSAHIAQLLGVFKDDFSGLGYEFLNLLALRRKLNYFPRIVSRFVKLCEQASGKVRVKLSLPYQPGDKLLEKLRGSLAGLGLYPDSSAALAEFDVTVDKSLVGGFIAECDGMLLDRSLRTKLMHISKG
jgi:ATP synthase F1 delta subunit